MNTPPSFPLTIFYPYTTFEYISRMFPILFSQYCIQNIGAKKSSYIFSAIPPVTFLLQAIFERNFSLIIFMITFFVTLSLNIEILKAIFKSYFKSRLKTKA